MRFTDLLATSTASLRQRPFRTLMTVLGVVIGTTSVVVMVSLGIGVTQSTMDSMASNATLRQVSVYGVPPDAAERGLPTELNEQLVAQLAQYPGVDNAWPIYNVDAIGQVDGASQWFQIQAVPQSMIDQLDLPLAWGSMPDGSAPGVVLGDMIPAQFFNEATGELLPVDFQSQTLFLDFDTSSMGGPMPSQEQGGDEGDAAQPQTKPKRVIMPVTGVVQGDPNVEWSLNSMVVYSELDSMLEVLKKAMPGKALPNQPATSDGKPKPGFVYSMVQLQTADPEAAEAVLTALRNEGYSADASIEWIREAQSQAVVIQAVFGGIGFVSLLVAAIGIANTMMMSVYERTREIGVMKVLGAGLGDIRRMFLFESASIGFFGGVLGLLLSLLGSSVLNSLAGSMMGDMTGGPTSISVIPVWLMVSAVAFATLIGTLAGLAPAFRASRLSPLAAIRAQ